MWLALVIFESWQPFLLPAVCLDFFLVLPDIFLLTSLSDDVTFSGSGLRLSSLTVDSLFLVDSSEALLGTLCSPDKFLSLLSTAVFLLFPTFGSSLLSSLPDSLPLSTPHHISTVFTSLLSWHLYSLHIPLSSHLCSLAILHISTLQKLLHTEAFRHNGFYAQKRLHRKEFKHNSFYTQKHVQKKLLHKSFYTQRLLHAETFTLQSFNTQKLLHTEA